MTILGIIGSPRRERGKTHEVVQEDIKALREDVKDIAETQVAIDQRVKSLGDKLTGMESRQEGRQERLEDILMQILRNGREVRPE